MKRLLLSVIAVLMLVITFAPAAQAQWGPRHRRGWGGPPPHRRWHRHQHCWWRHGHRVCRWG